MQPQCTSDEPSMDDLQLQSKDQRPISSRAHGVKWYAKEAPEYSCHIDRYGDMYVRYLYLFVGWLI